MRVEWLTESVGEQEILAALWQPVRQWWGGRFSSMSMAQRLAIPAIAAGQNVLVCAPTGTGKTLCAFISILSDLLQRASGGIDALPDCVDTLYISPLKALSADIARNLTAPLSEIAAAGDSPAIRIGQRTGDTTPAQRAAMVKTPPHILITTPESLALCLASAGMRRHLARVRRIIIDEIHSVAASKRGVDLMLSVERLADFVTQNGGADPQRIGLSATIAPLERMAEYLCGSRDCAIADAGFERPVELSIASVFGEENENPFIPAAAINRRVYALLESIIRTHRTTLVFTNRRAATERVTFALRKRFAQALKKGEESPEKMIHPEHIQAHHSSLDRDLRQDIERRMKAGELRCVVCSTSLELGVDIGTVDRVVLLSNPRGVARGLQRVGRSGHSLGGIACGTFLPTTPADLIEALVTRQAMRERAIEEIRIPRNCLDVLAQHLIGMAAQQYPEGIAPHRAYEIVRRTAAFADLPREDFDAVVRVLTGETGEENAPGYGRLHWDSEGAELESETRSSGSGSAEPLLRLPGKGAAALHAQNIGTIVQEGQVKVRITDGRNPRQRRGSLRPNAQTR